MEKDFLSSMLGFIRTSYWQTVGALLSIPFAIAGRRKPWEVIFKIVGYALSAISLYLLLSIGSTLLRQNIGFFCIAPDSSCPTIERGDFLLYATIHEDTRIEKGDLLAIGIGSLPANDGCLFDAGKLFRATPKGVFPVYGVPGDAIAIADGCLYVNGAIVLSGVKGNSAATLGEGEYLLVSQDEQGYDTATYSIDDIDGKILFK